jgi:DNA-directed RNA polymerase specialized sigma24 family protein
LPALYRQVYVLHELEGVPAAEVAVLLQLSPAAARGRLGRAKLLLRRALAAGFGADSEEPAC